METGENSSKEGLLVGTGFLPPGGENFFIIPEPMMVPGYIALY